MNESAETVDLAIRRLDPGHERLGAFQHLAQRRYSPWLARPRRCHRDHPRRHQPRRERRQVHLCRAADGDRGFSRGRAYRRREHGHHTGTGFQNIFGFPGVTTAISAADQYTYQVPVCTTTITGANSTRLTVTSGLTCLVNATQSGQVTVEPGAALSVTNSTVNGTVTATESGWPSPTAGPPRHGDTVRHRAYLRPGNPGRHPRRRHRLRRGHDPECGHHHRSHMPR